jgi:hypothetical protein
MRRFVLALLLFTVSIPLFAQGTIHFSHSRGFRTEGFDLTLTAPEQTVLRYTLNGAEPTHRSMVYTAPIPIRSRVGDPNSYSMISQVSTSYAPWAPPKSEVFKATVVRVAAFVDTVRVSPIHTQTYIIDPEGAQRYSLPVISLVTDSLHLFDYERGIYVLGKIYDDWRALNPTAVENGNTPTNFLQSGDEWERPMHIEFFEDDGRTAFAQDAGVRMHGAWARAFRQKTFRLYARNDYGSNRFRYRFFPDKELDDFRRILLRNSGQDWGKTMLRDGFMQRISQDLSFDTQFYRPAIVFLNGEYWGIHNIRDRYDDHYIESHYGVPRGQIDFLELNAVVQEGSATHYNDMIAFMRFNDTSQDARMRQLETMMDVVNYGEYAMAQIYINNRDWPHNNIDYWRKATAGFVSDAPYGHDGRWRWMMKDTDFGFGWNLGADAWKYDMLAFALSTTGNGHGDWATIILRSLLKNPTYRTWFITRYADLLNTTFSESTVLSTLESLAAAIEPEMEEHLNRWGVQDHRFSPPADLTGWQVNLDLMRHFAQNRPTVMRNLLNTRYSLGGSYRLTVDASPGGSVRVNTLTLPGEQAWSGLYFKAMDLRLVAVPSPGYEFVRWEGLQADAVEAVVRPSADLTVRPVFALASSLEWGEDRAESIVLMPAVPNPFNPRTVVGFRVETQDLASLRVRMTVHDILGRRVAVLVDGMMPAGTHSVTFDASALPSGVYLLRLSAGSEVRLGKLTLLK